MLWCWVRYKGAYIDSSFYVWTSTDGRMHQISNTFAKWEAHDFLCFILRWKIWSWLEHGSGRRLRCGHVVGRKDLLNMFFSERMDFYIIFVWKLAENEVRNFEVVDVEYWSQSVLDLFFDIQKMNCERNRRKRQSGQRLDLQICEWTGMAPTDRRESSFW